jgi:hypothetical protein
MSPLQRRIAALTDATAKLVAQLTELDQLRKQVSKALLLTKRAPRLKGRNETRTIPRVSLKSIELPARDRSADSKSTGTILRRTLLN